MTTLTEDLKELAESLETMSEAHERLASKGEGRAEYNRGRSEAFRVAAAAIIPLVWPPQPNLTEETTHALDD